VVRLTLAGRGEGDPANEPALLVNRDEGAATSRLLERPSQLP
jgi:hypothetical protein